MVNSLTASTSSSVGYNYYASNGTLQIGGLLNGVNGVQTGTYDFLFNISNLLTSPAVTFAGFARGNVTNEDYTGTVTVTPQVTPLAATPEPSSLALFATGLLAVGMAGRRYRTS